VELEFVPSGVLLISDPVVVKEGIQALASAAEDCDMRVG
jgi:hypothetical protein